MANEHILIVDDKIEIVSFLLDLLQPLGYVCTSATHGELGLKKALGEQPDLILLDLNMPGMDGIEVLENLRKRDCRSAVILMTLYGSENTVVQAFRLGVRDYISKPFNIPELLAAIEHALEQTRLRHERERLLVELERTNHELGRLYERSRQQTQQLATINRIASTVISSLDLDQVMHIVVGSVTEALHAETATLALLDEETGELVFHVRLDRDGPRPQPIRMKVGQGILGSAIQTGEPIVANDVPSDPRFFTGVDQVTGFHTRSILCVPLSIPGKVVGAIEAINKLEDGEPPTPGQFSERDQALLTGAAAFVAMAVENARLHEAMRESIATQTVRETVVTLSHYVSNPLQVLMGLAETLRRMADPQHARESAAQIEHEVTRIGAVMSVLREIASPESTVYLGSIHMLDIERELQARQQSMNRTFE